VTTLTQVAETHRPGPRGGGTDVRAEILWAARELFAEQGFRGTTIRAVAARAGVDVALVPYYFGNKDALFEAALDTAGDVSARLDELFVGDPASLGQRLVLGIDAMLSDEGSGSAMLALMRSAVAEGPGRQAALIFANAVILATYRRHIETPDAALRASLAASQIIGFALARYVLNIEPLASMSSTDAAANVGPTLQRYLLDPLPEACESARKLEA
jgi:AcrR family transcriptional regulator